MDPEVEPITIVLIVLGTLFLIAIIRSFQTIPQASAAVVERFGRYTRTLGSGLNIVVPLIDTVRSRIDFREQVVSFPPQPVVTQDHLVVKIDTVIYYQVTDARAATYEVANYILAIEELMVTTVRKIIGDMDLDRARASREEISFALRGILDEATGRWGIRVNRVELKNIELPPDVLAGLRAQAAAAAAPDGRHEAQAQAQAQVQTHPPRRGGQYGSPSQPKLVPLVPGDPSEIGKYRLVARLGQGGMGVVYLGRTPGERLVAVKVVRDDLDFDDTFRRRFRREVQAVRQVGGFFTASVVDAAPDADPPWLVTEYVPGPSLEQAVAEQGALSAKPLRALAAGLAEALEGIHACGIIHRDLKPSNIILTDSGPRVIDFGIARALDHSALTRTNQWVGTPGYLAPEQLAGGEVTPRADVYALGVVLCHAASGDFPYRGGAAPIDLLPSLLREIVAACLANDPHERPAPGEILKQLN